MSAGAMANVSGMRMTKRVPAPGREATETTPPIAWMFSRTTSRPTPRPETLVTARAVEKPGTKMKRATSSGDMAASSCSLASSSAAALRRIAS